MKVRVVILLPDTSPWPGLHNCEVSEGIQVMEQTRNCIWRGNNSESIKVRVAVLVRHTSTWPVLHSCKVSWLYSKGIQVTERKGIYIKSIKGEITQKVIKRELSFLNVTYCHDLFYITVKSVLSKYSKRYSSYWCGHGNVYGRTDRQTGTLLYPPSLLVGE